MYVYVHTCMYIYICYIIRDNVAYEGYIYIYICICIILEISSLLSKNYPGFRCACVMDNLIS